jgi:outer membrane protein assembly factor BamD (BamD/ComL family)
MFVIERLMYFFMPNLNKTIGTIAIMLLVLFTNAQPNTNVDLDKDKPKQYENRKLGSEKSGEKKFTLSRRITQNTYTHYNYYFNANNKLNGVIEKAKTVYKDDYTQMLSFYNYTLDGTVQSKDDLDSVIYKCTAGILLHDLRNDWIDNLYMLLGKAYLYRKNFDSAAGCFQYINYVYAPKNDGYDVPLGSNASNTKGVFTISTNEKRSLWKKMTSKPPSRNESFVWQIRNYLEQDMLGEAAGLIGILRSDPNFPKRLKTDLHEMIAYWFYKQQNYDSSAWHLQKSLDNAEGRGEEARWEYLAGQLYQTAHKDSMAIVMFERSVKHTLDPLMEVYARLNIVGLSSGKKKDALQNNLNELLKLTKRDKYVDYRDIIYYAAAKLELKRNSLDAAQDNLLKSVKYSTDNKEQKSISYIALGDLNFDRKKFIPAEVFYDSVQLETVKTIAKEDVERVKLRKSSLKVIAQNLVLIHKEDSLQRVALMPEAERTAYVKKELKKLRKAKGLKGSSEEEGSYNTGAADSKKADLFGDTKGEFYFSSINIKSKGFSEFKSKWGKRNNVDNWRRQAALDKVTTKKDISRNPGVTMDIDDIGVDTKKRTDEKKEAGDVAEEEELDLSFEGLMSKLPLTKELLTASDLKIQRALFVNGETFQSSLEAYDAAVYSYDTLLKRFNEFKQKEPALFNLYYCYTKLGLKVQADSVLAVLRNDFPDGESYKTIQQGNNPPEKEKNKTATKTYETIYNLFIEGKFEEAKAMKAKADATYGKTFWTPQLLMIESVYYIKIKEDSTAINKLKEVAKMVPGTPLAIKALNMIDVLSRRKEIEKYLTDLAVERAEETVEKSVDLVDPTVEVKKQEAKKNDGLKQTDAIKTIDKKATVAPIVDATKKIFSFNATDSQYVMISLEKVDRVFVNEAKGAFAQFNRERIYNQKIDITVNNLNEDYALLLLGPFENAGKAFDYVEKARPLAVTRIIPWIPAAKYNFSLISNANLLLLNANKEITNYINFIKQTIPGKF